MDEEIGQALWYIGPGRAEIRTETLIPLGLQELRVRSLWGALSRGTESLIFAGRVPPTEFERMRSPNMGGNFPYPVKYGYSIVGRAETGRRTCLAGLCSSFTLTRLFSTYLAPR